MSDCYLYAKMEEPVLVLPVCCRDQQMMVKNLQWMRELDGRLPYDAIVSHDTVLNRHLAAQVIDEARATFASVDVFIYDRPMMVAWPWAANWSFQQFAWHQYSSVGRPWFWLEADAVPLCSGWLPRWFAEYAACGKPIMGSVVEGRGHCNGTAIYPWNFAELSPKAMQATDVAWDWVMKEETIHLTHHSHLMQHCWGIVNGKATPYGGEAAMFRRQQDVDDWVRPDAVLFHRSKFGDLIDLLRERRKTASVRPAHTGPGGGGVMA